MKEVVIIVQSPKGIKKYDFDKDIISIGRSRENDIILEDETVSSFHATLTYDPSLDLYVLLDLNSKNGTFVGENKISTSFPLEKATLVSIGKNKLQIFPAEIKEGQRTVLFSFEDFTRNLPEEVKRDITKDLTFPFQKKVEENITVVDSRESSFWEIAFLEGEYKGKSFRILKDKKEIFFGRSTECDFVFSDQRISRKHFKIYIKEDKIFLKNLKGINPVIVNGREIREEEIPLEDGCLIKVQEELLKLNYVGSTKEISKKELQREQKKEFEMEILYPHSRIAHYIIRGPLNLDTYFKLENSLLSQLSPEKKWAILDFKEVSLIDYPALASLLKIIAEYNQRGGEIILLNISRELERTFELVNVLRYLNKFRKENLKEALKYLESRFE